MQDPINWIDPSGLRTDPSGGGGWVLPIATGGGGGAGIAPIVFTRPPPLPIKGPAGGTLDRPSSNGDKCQEREYDNSGNPVKDIDWGHDHGAGRPHVHDWTYPPGSSIPIRGPGRPQDREKLNRTRK